MGAKLLSDCLSLLFPDDCRTCGKALQEFSRIPVCRACLDSVRPFEADYFCSICRTPFANAYPLDGEGRCPLCRRGTNRFDAVYCYGAYDGILRDLIHLFKYGRVKTLAKPLAAYLLQALPARERFDVLTPAPLHWRRRLWRGFNQAALLAKELSRKTSLPVEEGLVRVRPRPPQAGLSNAERRRNVAGVFAVREGCDFRNRRVLLVDDVITTGATAAAAAAALKSAGASHVAVVAVARADRRWFAFPGPAQVRDPDLFRGNFEYAVRGSNAPTGFGPERQLRAD